jgi:hypothetical protein
MSRTLQLAYRLRRLLAQRPPRPPSRRMKPRAPQDRVVTYGDSDLNSAPAPTLVRRIENAVRAMSAASNDGRTGPRAKPNQSRTHASARERQRTASMTQHHPVVIARYEGSGLRHHRRRPLLRQRLSVRSAPRPRRVGSCVVYPARNTIAHDLRTRSSCQRRLLHPRRNNSSLEAAALRAAAYSSSTARTLRARSSSEYGFSKQRASASSTPLCTMAFCV